MDSKRQDGQVANETTPSGSTESGLGSGPSSSSSNSPRTAGANSETWTPTELGACGPEVSSLSSKADGITTESDSIQVDEEGRDPAPSESTLQGTPTTPLPNPPSPVSAPDIPETPGNSKSDFYSTSYFPFNPDIIEEICEYLAVAYLSSTTDTEVSPEARSTSHGDDDDDDDDDVGTVDAMPGPPSPISPLAILHRSRQTLLSTALTCKRLLEPCLDRLWRHLDSLFPLLKLLPAFVRSDGTWVLRGPITQAQWTRFDYYAFRVRAFTFTRDPDTLDIAMHVYFRLAQLRASYIPPPTLFPYSATTTLQMHSKGLPLLPNLHHLHCPCTSQTDFLISGICLFLSPSLRSVKFEGISSVEDKLCGTVLYELLGENPDGEYIEPSGVYHRGHDEEHQTRSERYQSSLECVTLRGRGLSYDTLRLLPRFLHLRVLALEGMGDALNSSVLKGLAKLECLKVLGIDFTGVHWDEVLEGNTSKGIRTDDDDEAGNYKELRSLAIIAPLGVVFNFVKRLTTKSLETISVVSPHADPPSLVHTYPQVTKVDKESLISHLASTWSSSLRRVELVLQPRDDDGSEFDQPLPGMPVPPPPMALPVAPPPPMPGMVPMPGHQMGGWMAAPPQPVPNPPNPGNIAINATQQPPVIVVQAPANNVLPPPPLVPAPTPSTYSNPHTLTLNTLGSLLRLAKLTHLRIEGYPTSLNDEDVKEMAGCWDGLEDLELPFISGSTEGSNELKKPTTKSLAVFARSCRKLKSLKLSLNLDGVSSIPLPSTHSGSSKTPSSCRWSPPYSHPLTHISLSPPSSFSSSPTFAPQHNHDDSDGIFELRDLLHLARHIDTYFPNVQCVSVFDGLPSNSSNDDGFLGSGSFWRDSFDDDNGYGGVNDFAGIYNWSVNGPPERWRALSDTVRMYQGVRRDALRAERWRAKVQGGH